MILEKNNINFENILILEEYINATDPNNRFCRSCLTSGSDF